MKTILLLLHLLNPVQAAPGGCTALIHIGDSITVAIRKDLEQNYLKQGFINVHVSAGNGRSIVRSQPPDPMSGLQAIDHYRKITPAGRCWVIDLGTNDSGQTRPDKATRIKSAVQALGKDRAVWVTVNTNSTSRPNYNGLNAYAWNTLLLWNGQKVIDWAGMVQPGWHTNDGIHYRSTANRVRAVWIPEQAKAKLNG